MTQQRVSPVSITSVLPATVTLSVQGALGQSVDLQRWQSSAGSVYSYVNSNGNFIVNAGLSVTGNLGGVANMVIYGSAGSARVSQVIQQGASQTGDAFQVQNSAGTVLSSVSNVGAITAPSFNGGVISLTPVAYASNQSGGISFQDTSLAWTAGGVYARSNGVGTPRIGIVPVGLNQELLSVVASGYVGVNTVAPQATLHVTSLNTASLGLMVRGVASQTADLQQWQNSAGSVVGGVTAGGSMYIARGTAFAANAFGVNTGATTNIGVIVRGEAAQTADLQQWQASTSAVPTRISASGSLTVSDTTYDGITSSSFVGTTIGNIALQPAIDMRRWTGSAAIYKSASIVDDEVNGLLFKTDTTSTYAAATTERMRIDFNGTVRISGFTSAVQGLIVRGAASQTAALQEWQNSAGSNVATMSATGGAQFAGLNVQMTGAAIANIGTAITTAVGLIIRGVASQTANLQEWQISDGTVRSRIDSNGYIIGGFRNTFGNFTGIVSGVAVAISAEAAVTIPLMVRGAASQTANLQQWEDNAGLVLVAIPPASASNAFTSNIGAHINSVRGNYFGIVMFVNPTQPGHIGAVIRGAASQTANLQEWQNSAGTVLARVNPSGQFVGDGSQLTGISAGANEIMVIMGAY